MPQPTQNWVLHCRHVFTTLLFQSKTCLSGPTGHENLSNYSPGTADRPSLQVELASISKQRTAVVIGHKVFKPFPALTPQCNKLLAQFGAYFRAIAGSGAPLRGCTALGEVDSSGGV